MIRLNLPPYTFRTRENEKGNQIFDAIRKKFVTLSPEEWVRQNLVRYFIEEKKYPASLIALETGLNYNRQKKRSDITVYNRQGDIWMIIECKAPDVKISQETFNQVAIYNMSGRTRTKFLAVSNGLKHYCCEMKYTPNAYDFLKDFPEF